MIFLNLGCLAELSEIRRATESCLAAYQRLAA
jgi:hypothetical protein